VALVTLGYGCSLGTGRKKKVMTLMTNRNFLVYNQLAAFIPEKGDNLSDNTNLQVPETSSKTISSNHSERVTPLSLS
jgi:hypothetical protein